MTYSAKEIQSSQGGGRSKIPVGIHSKADLASVEVGDNYIDFNYELGGWYNNKRVWFPDKNNLFKNSDESDEDALKRMENEALAHVVKHLNIFLTEEEFDNFTANTFVEFVKKAAELLNKFKDREKVNLKLVYDKEGLYSTFGRFPNYIEKYVEGKEPTLQYSEWEKENRVKPKISLDNSEETIVSSQSLF